MFGRTHKYYPTEEEIHDAELQLKVQRLIYDDQQRLQFTPDYRELSQVRAHPIFIHDDMAQTQPHHDLVKNNSLSGFYPLHYGYTSRRFSFIKKELGLKSFPIALDLREKEDLPVFMTETHRIRGEIYMVRPQGIINLDTHRQNGVQFTRTKVNINIGSRKLYRRHWFNAEGVKKFDYELGREEMCTQECWMYVGREAYWKDQLSHTDGFFNFKPIDIIQEDRLWLKEYYQYSRVR